MLGKDIPWVIGLAVAMLGMLLVSIFSGTVMYFLWNYLSLKYFYFLSEAYHHIPWWHCVCFTWLINIISPFKSTITAGK